VSAARFAPLPASVSSAPARGGAEEGCSVATEPRLVGAKAPADQGCASRV